MADYVFGANLLEILTTGMYQYSQIIFREYIQNSCDAIDKAVSLGILKPGEGKIDIWIDKDKRIISVEDNGTGIFAEEFELTLQSIHYNLSLNQASSLIPKKASVALADYAGWLTVVNLSSALLPRAKNQFPR